MARGGKIGVGRKRKNRDNVGEGFSDESDEDYKVNEDEELDQTDDEYCSSLAESQDSLWECQEEEEEDWVESKVKKVGRPKGQVALQSRKDSSFVRPRKKRNCSDYFSTAMPQRDNALVDLEKDYTSSCLIREAMFEFDRKPRSKSRAIRTSKYVNLHSNSVSEEKLVELPEEEEECDDNHNDGTDNEDDEEFILSEDTDTSVSESVEKQDKRKNKSVSAKEVVRKKRNGAARKKKSKSGHSGSRISNESSDSDFGISGSSDYEYTISEEEREQIREANEICGGLNDDLRSSALLETIEEEELPLEKKNTGRNGKQKVVDLKIEIGKQVCGICLSEERKRTVIGVLNCCTHYFCFACIMEWSKVESRCPLCKQRFATISKIVRSDGHDLRDAIFPVPERDQVYQPSEEELRGYLDPYENVLCTECLQGGDDGLMLLCDLCDSPAHTYCVGLGRVVPDGNWYCDGCRPTALASFNPQAPNSNPDLGTTNLSTIISSPMGMGRLPFDLNEAYVPETPPSQLPGYYQSPRNSVSQSQPSPVSGIGAVTLFERRRIQRQIHLMMNNSRRQIERTDIVPAAGPDMNMLGSLIRREVLVTAPSTIRPPALSYARSPSMNGRPFYGHSSTSNGEQWHQGFANGVSGHQQLSYPCNTTSNVVTNSTLPYPFSEATLPSHTFQGRQQTRF